MALGSWQRRFFCAAIAFSPFWFGHPLGLFYLVGHQGAFPRGSLVVFRVRCRSFPPELPFCNGPSHLPHSQPVLLCASLPVPFPVPAPTGTHTVYPVRFGSYRRSSLPALSPPSLHPCYCLMFAGSFCVGFFIRGSSGFLLPGGVALLPAVCTHSWPPLPAVAQRSFTHGTIPVRLAPPPAPLLPHASFSFSAAPAFSPFVPLPLPGWGLLVSTDNVYNN